MVWQLVTAMALAGANPQAAADFEPVGEVVYQLGERADYPVNLAYRYDTVAVSFDFPCVFRPFAKGPFHFAFLGEAMEPDAYGDADDDLGPGPISPTGEHALIITLKRKPTKDLNLQVSLMCDSGVQVPLRLQTSEPHKRTASVRITLADDMASQLSVAKSVAKKEAKEELERAYQAKLVEVRRLYGQAFLKAQQGAQIDDFERTRASEGRAAIVYVTQTKRFGHYGVVDFKLENAHANVLHIQSITVSADDTPFQQTYVVNTSRIQMETDKDIEAGQSIDEIMRSLEDGTAPLVFYAPKASLTVAEATKASIRVPLPWLRSSPGSITLTVKTSGGEVTVPNIPIPAARS